MVINIYKCVVIIKVEVAPYWNVNNYVISKSRLYISVEVAPYWNVNFLLPIP